MNRDSRYLESILHHDIPLTREMGLKVVAWHDRQLRLHLPLDANINHKSTMFGGSLYCGAVLAGRWRRALRAIFSQRNPPTFLGKRRNC